MNAQANDDLANFIERWRALHKLHPADVIEMLAEATRLEAARIERPIAHVRDRVEFIYAFDHNDCEVKFIVNGSVDPDGISVDIRKPVRLCFSCGRVFRAHQAGYTCRESGTWERATLVGYEPFASEATP